MPTLYFKDSTWWMNYSVNGQRFRVSTGTGNKQLAEIKLNELKLKIFKGEIGAKRSAGKRATVSEFFRRYRDYIQSNSNVDKHSDLARLRAFQEFFARQSVRYIATIDPNLVDEFRATVLVDRKPKTVKNYITLLKTALNKAVEWGLIESNPIAKVKSPKIVKTFHFFSKDEIKRLIEEAPEPLKSAILILVNTGIRRAELFHLRWRDVDFPNKNLRVWPYDGFSPKGKRPRRIPISKSLLPLLKRLSKGNSEDDYVLRPHKSEHRFYKHFVALLNELGIKGTLHDLRHTFASHLAMAGTPIPVLKELLGHSDISTTMIYAHLSPDIHRAEVEKLPF